MTGTLYVIGVGPGDPELLTLKAMRILMDVRCICVPKGKERGSSLVLSIVKRVLSLDNKEIIEAYFPMRKTRNLEGSCELDTRWQETVETILSVLNKGKDIAFLTMGDPTIYSSFFYIYDSLLELNPALKIEIIPGVSSINAGASRLQISLGLADEKIAILPATYLSLKPSALSLSSVLKNFDTIVLMKVHKVFDNLLLFLNEMNLLNKAIYISKAGMEDEKIVRNLEDVKEEDLNYFSMVIVRK